MVCLSTCPEINGSSALSRRFEAFSHVVAESCCLLLLWDERRYTHHVMYFLHMLSPKQLYRLHFNNQVHCLLLISCVQAHVRRQS